MKKIIIYVLCLCLLLSFAACGGNETEASVDEVSNSSEAASETESKTEETSTGTYCELAAKIDSVYEDDIPENPQYVNIAGGCGYTFGREVNKKYPDDNFTKLTDSVTAELGDDNWAGFIGKTEISVTLDLGSVKEGLCRISINNQVYSTAGCNVPKTCKFYISSDGVEYIYIGSSLRYPEVISVDQIYTHSISTQKTFSARYVQVVFTDFLSMWTCLDSFEVCTATEQTIEDSDSYYTNEIMPTVDETLLWDSSESDYETNQNLLLGLTQRIYEGGALLESIQTDYYNTKANSKLLTNGKRGGSGYADTEYFHTTRGLSRTFIYDIGKLSALNSATAGIYAYDDYAITVPENITVLLSENGVDWQTVAYKSADEYPAFRGNRADIKFDFDGTYKARFVKFVLTITAHTWIDEFEAYGTKKIPDDAKTLVKDKEEATDMGYNSPSDLGGVENILLAYHYTPGSELGKITKEGYLPYVGYYDTEGNLVDYFFDSYLYLPCVRACPSGGYLYASSETPSILSDWLDYKADLFYENRNLDALEEAVGEVKSALGDEDYQVTTFLTILNPSKKATSFGDVDGDGKTENMSKLADRKKVVKWWIDTLIEEYTACDYKNQKLVGFYWYDESLDLSDSVMKGTLEFAINYVHSLGYYIIWIPYYQASGFAEWKNVGFDAANMQPNYMFNEDATENVLYGNAEITKSIGMGVEIEISGNAISLADYHERYLAYLRVGMETGYMNAIKMYYQDAGPGVYYNCWKSSDPYVRMIYDLTYKYAKGLLTSDFGKVGGDVVSAAINTQYEGELTFDGVNCSGLEVLLSPKYGSVAVSSSGKFIYYPLEDFTGTDTFVVYATDGVSKNKVTITVSVTEGAE